MHMKIVLFDDNENTRSVIESLLKDNDDLQVVGVFDNLDACVRKVLKCKADLVLMDVEVSGVNAMNDIKSLKSSIPYVVILVQTAHEESSYIFECFRAGAAGYILKSNLSQSLVSAIRELQSGGAPMTPIMARKLVNFIHKRGDEPPVKLVRHYNLTMKERDVLKHVVNGLSYKMISYELGISYETIRGHMKKIYNKLDVGSLTEVVSKAIKQNIV